MAMREEQYIEPVNISKFALQKHEVAVDGKSLPFKIGDKLQFSENEKTAKTIMGISIFEDGRVSYMLEWYDPENGSFASETVTLSEIKLLQSNCIKKAKAVAGFNKFKSK